MHVTFLSDKPSDDNVTKIKTCDYKHDEFAVVNQAVYLYCPNGYNNSKLTNTFLETKLKISATTRNWKTYNELIALAEKA